MLADGGPIAYDTLIVATGAHHTYFNHPEWATIAPGLKTIEDATEIRRRILIAFEAAEREADPELRRAWMTFVLVGGGPTGVELAGALGEIAHDTLRRDFRSIHPERGADHPGRGDGPGPAAIPAGSLGVGAATARAAGRRGPDGDPRRRPRRRRACASPAPTARRSEIPARTVLWAAGILTRRASRRDGRDGDRAPRTDRSGRVIVEPDLTIPGHPEIFVVGDAAVQPWKPDKPTPGVAQGAMQGGYVRREGHPPPHPRPAIRAVPLQRPRRRRGHRPAGGRHQHPAGWGRSGGRAASRPGCSGWASTSST